MSYRTGTSRLSDYSTQWLSRAVTWIATGFGVGRVPIAPGTFGTLLGVALYLPMRELSVLAYLVAVAMLFAVGSLLCRIAERRLEAKDHPAIVFDEMVGCLITLWLAPPGWIWLAVGFGLFRLFDIWKPFPIRRLEHLPHGVGVMADDALAGMYGFLVLQALAKFGHAYFY